MSNNSIREASHAGSWYESDGNYLDQQLATWIQEANSSTNGQLKARAIIAPHAGYSYSGPTAAYAYKYIDPTDIDHVFLLGPSHHYSLTTCALTNHTLYQTPLYNIQIDTQISSGLHKTGLFSLMNKQQDSDEHSLEMHLPYIAKIFEKKRKDFKLVPILVGSLDSSKLEKYGQLLAPYLCNPRILFVISSDFCHWGRRFSYNPHDPADGEIWQFIEKLDHKGMELIEKMSLPDFHNYLRSTDNTICGRYPISLLLATIDQAKKVIPPNQLPKFHMQFVKYAQSSQVKKSNDSSVSYASAVLTVVG
ncbi:unnamed protein product [Adineta steineri]|uniref:Uncharacterized protein n=1 Tax=Adineta steineri TaxID=433720 RepID=A0A814NT88_9BILA|nr:unnamed protein product [Adineta steineri]CAF3709480.1 unnamed protein product [Adineta steineri]